MSATAQYASTVQLGLGTVATADTSRTAPTTYAHICAGGQLGKRIDRINMCAHGATVASVVRLFLCKGYVGPAITSITFSGTTATVTTAAAHGLTSGFKLTLAGAAPFDYNVDDVAVTVLTATTFTFPMATTPTANAVVVGAFTYTVAAPTHKLLSETLVTAITPSATVAAYTANLSSSVNPQNLPIFIPAGWVLRATVNDTQTSSGINVFAFGGDF